FTAQNPRVLLPGAANDPAFVKMVGEMDDKQFEAVTGGLIDIGIIARKNANGFVAVELGLGADPKTFTRELVASEKAGMPGWRWRKEYGRDFLAQQGMPVFEPEWLDHQRRKVREPLYLLDLDESGKKLIKRDRGRIKVWISPLHQPKKGLPEGEKVRLSFGAGSDVSEGVEASDSTIVVLRADTREQAAEFADNTIRPSNLGRVAVAMGKYFNDALFCVVRKLHGITVIRTMLDAGYPYLWHEKVSDRAVETNAARIGWPKGEVSSPLLFGKWMDCIQHHNVTLRSTTIVHQHEQYIYDDMGRITHQSLSHLPVEVRQRHGDLVIGAALAYRACLDMPKFRKRLKEEAPRGSFQWRHNLAMKAKKDGQERW
ncbi:hypothetical protein LCGC14_2775170, partial [marine sediment metagenome]